MRVLPIGLLVLGLMGIALVGVTSPATPVNKVVIGVLDFETSGPAVRSHEEKKKVLMKELRRNTWVKVVNIRESCSLSDLKRNGYLLAERYKDRHQLDMILHIYLTDAGPTSPPFGRSDLSLIDLYTKRVKEVSIETVGMPIEFGFRGISQTLLASGDINRVLRDKKEDLAKKEVAVPQEVKEITKEEVRQFFGNYVEQYTQRDIDGFLSQFSLKALQNGRDGFDRIRKIYSDFFDQSEELRYHIDDMRMQIYQNTVHVIARYKVDQILKKEGKRGTWRGDIHWILVRENGALKVRYLDYRHYRPQKSP